MRSPAQRRHSGSLPPSSAKGGGASWGVFSSFLMGWSILAGLAFTPGSAQGQVMTSPSFSVSGGVTGGGTPQPQTSPSFQSVGAAAEVPVGSLSSPSFTASLGLAGALQNVDGTPPVFSNQQVSSDTVNWKSSGTVLNSNFVSARITVQDSDGGLNPASFAVVYTTTGWSSSIAVPAASVLVASTSATSPMTLTVLNLSVGHSTVLNQVAFTAADLTGNVATSTVGLQTPNLVTSTVTTNGQPEMAVTASTPVAAAIVPNPSYDPISVGTCAGPLPCGGLTALSNLYNLTPEMTPFSPLAQIVFAYNNTCSTCPYYLGATKPAALSVWDWNTLNYSLSNGTGTWYDLCNDPQLAAPTALHPGNTGQNYCVLNTTNHTLTAYVSMVFSLVMLWGDTTPPAFDLANAQVSQDGVNWALATSTAVTSPVASARIAVQDFGGLDTGKMSARYTNNGGATWLAVAPSQLSLTLSSAALGTKKGTVTASALPVNRLLTAGANKVAFTAFDVAGNVTVATVTIPIVRLDTTPPITALTLSGGHSFSRFGQTYATPDTLFVLKATDDLSGVQSTSFGIDGAALRAYAAPFSLAEGTHTITYFSQDNAGNIEAANARTFNVSVFQANAISAGSKNANVLSGNVAAGGNVTADGAVNLNGHPTIQGNVTAPAIALTGNSRITGAQTILANALNPSPFDLGAALSNATASNNNAAIAAYIDKNGVLNVKGKTTLTLSTGTYLLKGIDLDGGAVVRIIGPVSLFVQGLINLSGGSQLNSDANGDAENLVIFSNSSAGATITGNSSLGALLYSPNGTANLSGNSTFGGHLFAGTVSLSGGVILQAGHAVPASSKKGAALFADGTFQLGQVYAFPNPAKRGANPTIHIEAGIADSIDIHIYDISGNLVKSVTISDPPQQIDDGSGRGAQYAYEWTWDVSGAGSGVYVYVATAHNGSNTLRVTKKVAVIK